MPFVMLMGKPPTWVTWVCWPLVIIAGGDVRAVHEIRKIIEARVRLLGLHTKATPVTAARPVIDRAFWAMLKEPMEETCRPGTTP